MQSGCTGVGNYYSFVVASRSNDGVCHADELFMLFKAHQVPVTMVRTQADKRVRQEEEEFSHLQLTLLGILVPGELKHAANVDGLCQGGQPHSPGQLMAESGL